MVINKVKNVDITRNTNINCSKISPIDNLQDILHEISRFKNLHPL